MARLDPGKLQVTFASGTQRHGPMVPRRYTLTHSDVTGNLYLSIGSDYDREKVSGWQTRLMRDEVLAEWVGGEAGAVLHVHCHVSGGILFGTAGMRDAIFRRELPLVLEAFRLGDLDLYRSCPELDQAPIMVHFHATQRRYNLVEQWGKPADYAL
jgi:hypothetical protein